MEVLIANEDCSDEVRLTCNRIPSSTGNDDSCYLHDLTCNVQPHDDSFVRWFFLSETEPAPTVVIDGQRITISDLKANRWYKATVKAMNKNSITSLCEQISTEIDFHTGMQNNI